MLRFSFHILLIFSTFMCALNFYSHHNVDEWCIDLKTQERAKHRSFTVLAGNLLLHQYNILVHYYYTPETLRCNKNVKYIFLYFRITSYCICFLKKGHMF